MNKSNTCNSRVQKLFQILKSNRLNNITKKSLTRLFQKLNSASTNWRKISAASLLFASYKNFPSKIFLKKFSEGKSVVRSFSEAEAQVINKIEEYSEKKNLEKFIFFYQKKKFDSENFQFFDVQDLKKFSLDNFLKNFPDPKIFEIFYFENEDVGFKNRNRIRIGDLNWDENKEKLRKFKDEIDLLIQSQYGKKVQKETHIDQKISISSSSAQIDETKVRKILKKNFKNTLQKFVTSPKKAKTGRSKSLNRRLIKNKRSFRVRSISRKNNCERKENSSFKLKKTSALGACRKMKTMKIRSKKFRKNLFSKEIKSTENKDIFDLILQGEAEERNSVPDFNSPYLKSKKINFFKINRSGAYGR